MSIYDKISNAQETTWLTDGIAEAEAKSIIELAKISAKIERRRLELNMTQKEFAEFINCSKPTVERWERSIYECITRYGITLGKQRIQFHNKNSK